MPRASTTAKYAKYRNRPAAFAREVLKFEPTPEQERMWAGLLVPSYRDLCLSTNEQGKTAEAIQIRIDDDGMCGTLSSFLIGKGFNVTRVSAASKAIDSEHYPNKRSELWFVTAERARRGELDLSGLDPDTRDELRRQALTATWSLDADGRRVVAPKDKLKELLKRSPDGVDAMNLSYFAATPSGPGLCITTTRNIPTRSL